MLCSGQGETLLRGEISTAAWTNSRQVSRLSVRGWHWDESLVRTGWGGVVPGIQPLIFSSGLGTQFRNVPPLKACDGNEKRKDKGSTQNTLSHALHAGKHGQVPARRVSQPIPAQFLRNRLCGDSSSSWYCYTFHLITA